ncbi:MAG: sterol desaturase family protein [Myxococcaceae bacterium]
MKLNPIALAVPLFFMFIGVELLIAKKMGRKVYRFADSITDLACGMTNQVIAIVFGAALLAGYTFFYDRATLFHVPMWAQWLVAFVGVDFLYYWWHRASHEVNFFWAAHVVHHSSEDYNLAVALRQGAFTSMTSWPFYLPLAFLGVSPIVFATMVALSTLYQFWIHTELVKPMPAVDRVINTPSAHRVHHAINLRYLDKNYAAILMIWDRMFGSFEPETEVPVYGISVPLNSFSPLWAQLHYWGEMWKIARAAPSFAQGFSVLWRSPAWQPAWIPKKESCYRPGGIEKYNPRPSRAVRLYVISHFAVVAAMMFSILMWGEKLSRGWTYAACGFVIVSLVSWGGLFEAKKWARPLEVGRMVALAAGVCSALFLSVR